MIAVGEKAPDFTLPDHTGSEVSLTDFTGKKVLLVFYPLDFSPVCTDQLSLYEGIRSELDDANVEVLAISVDSAFAHKAFRDQLGIETSLLADFEPKGAVAASYGAYMADAGFANRSLVLIGDDGTVEWVHEAESPGEIPPPELILGALSA